VLFPPSLSSAAKAYFEWPGDLTPTAKLKEFKMTKTSKFRSDLATAIAVISLSGGVALTSFTAVNAAEMVQKVAMVDTAQSGNFQNSTYNITGSWTIVKENGQTILRLSDDFKTKNGPDLKLFLSPSKVGTLTGKTALNEAVRLSVLKSSKGGQDYVIPVNIDISDFESILIHCEAFSVLWGGADI